MRAKITIILPNFNSYKTLKKTVNSIQNQSYKNWKLIIVDDNSDNKTLKILSKFKKEKKIKIFYLKKNKLKEQLKFMIKNKYNFSYTHYITEKDYLKKKIVTPLVYNFNTFIINTSIATSCMIVKKFNDKKIKFLNITSCDDYYFKCALLKKYKFAYCYPKFLTSYKIRSDSVQSNRFRNLFWVWKINRNYNKLNFFKNLFSVLNISISSLMKYGFR